MPGNHGLTSALRCVIAASLALAAAAAQPAVAADPIKLGFSMALTGGVAPNGKQMLVAFQIWREEINAKGGLLGRPVELVYYDDQSNPANVPAIYTKLIDVDKVDLLIGPYATNMVVPAIPVIMQHNKLTLGLLALAANQQFHYPKYFAMISTGPNPKVAYSEGFFELAKAQKPTPTTVAIVAADAEFAQNSADGARANAKKFGFRIVYDKSYPPATTDFTPIVRAIQATNPDIVFGAAYPPDTLGLVRAVNETGFTPKMFGGTLIGLLATPFKMQLGPALNGIVVSTTFTPAPTFASPAVMELLGKYQARAQGQGIDPLGYGFVPYAYGGVQVLAQAVEATKSLDHDKLADYIRSNAFSTVVGNVRFGKDGEWTESNLLFTQFQNVTGNDLGQFRGADKEVVIWPQKYKTADMIYPYANARSKK
jgi:branched-chain amino acid transport system substrate-binding protein